MEKSIGEPDRQSLCRKLFTPHNSAIVCESIPPGRKTGFPDKWRLTCGHRYCGTRPAHLRGAQTLFRWWLSGGMADGDSVTFEADFVNKHSLGKYPGRRKDTAEFRGREVATFFDESGSFGMLSSDVSQNDPRGLARNLRIARSFSLNV